MTRRVQVIGKKDNVYGGARWSTRSSETSLGGEQAAV